MSEDDDLDAIKARGEMSRAGTAEDVPGMGDTHGSLAAVDLEIGKNYCFRSDLGEMPFVVETGGVIQGENITGSVQGGKVIFTSGNKEVEGTFVKPTVVLASWTDG